MVDVVVYYARTDSKVIQTKTVKSAWKPRENTWKVRETPVNMRHSVFHKLSRKSVATFNLNIYAFAAVS